MDEEEKRRAEEESQKIKVFFLKNAVFFDTLDEKFNSLRNIKYNTKAKKVINAYATVFILMMKTLYNLDDSFSWKYEDLFEKLAKDSDVFRCGKSKIRITALWRRVSLSVISSQRIIPIWRKREPVKM